MASSVVGKITRIIAISNSDADPYQRGDIRVYLNDQTSWWKIDAGDVFQKNLLTLALSAQATGSTVHFETVGTFGTDITRLWLISP